MRLKTYVCEEVTKKGLGLTFVDIDETLFRTFAKVNVIDKDGSLVTSLSNSEYNSYKKNPGETFDYSEFTNAEIFNKTSVPIEPMIKRIKEIVRRTDSKGSKVILLTARTDMDDKEVFLDTFRKAGFPIDKTYVERAPIGKYTSIARYKKEVVMEYLSTGVYRRIRIFDDYLKTCKSFLSIKNDLPKEVYNKVREVYGLEDIPEKDLIEFTAYHVQEDGSVKEVSI